MWNTYLNVKRLWGVVPRNLVFLEKIKKGSMYEKSDVVKRFKIHYGYRGGGDKQSDAMFVVNLHTIETMRGYNR